MGDGTTFAIGGKHLDMSLRVKQTNSLWARAPVFQLIDIHREPGLAPIGSSIR